MAMPTTIAETLASVLILGGARPKTHVARRVATTFVAYQRSDRICPVRASGPTLSIWMNETLRYMYATLPKIKLKLNIAPMGTIAVL